MVLLRIVEGNALLHMHSGGDKLSEEVQTTFQRDVGLQAERCILLAFGHAEQLLGELGIPIVAKHCGGKQGRRMSLNTANGKVVIEIVGQGPIEL